jgi:hypothetical protein
MSLEMNESLFTSLIGYQIVGVERFDGRLLVMLTNGEATKMIELERFAKVKKVR